MTSIDPGSVSVEDRARQSKGTSADAIYTMVARALGTRRSEGTLLDVGCGTGNFWPYVQDKFDRYIGTDVVRYNGFPDAGEFLALDLDSGRLPVPDAIADVVVAIETIEHLENPRAFVRELVRLAKPGGVVAISTPNQLSLLSKGTLLFRNEFNAFRAGSYPAHITALLEVDLRRIAKECGLQDCQISYSGQGRIVLTSRHYPYFMAKLFRRALSDNVLLTGKKSE